MFYQRGHKIFETSDSNIQNVALEIFRFQYENNPTYRNYIQALGNHPEKIDRLEKIPFLPISFFKTHEVKTTEFEPVTIFESSGTTGTTSSKHFVKDITLYKKSFIRSFELFYGPVDDWCILGLLPSYLERNNSSLVYMVEKLINLSEHPQSGFYLNEFEKIYAVICELEKRKQKTLLIGVTYALLDFAEIFSLPLIHTIIMETGGMKGRREEMVRDEVHSILKKAFHLPHVHSEYGMTELLSQAYSKGDGVFRCPPWMKIMTRDEEDPLLIRNSSDAEQKNGAINIIDLANIYSCSFIATDDIGKVYPNGSFEVLGRLDNSDLRGCSLMVSGL